MTHDIRFIATDMDGTLLDARKQLPDSFYPMFAKLKQQGILFAAASGRQYLSLKHTFAQVAEEMVFIADNGTIVFYQDQELYSATMNPTDVREIIQLTRTTAHSHLVLCGKQRAYIDSQDPQVLAEVKHYYHALEIVPDLLAVEDEIIKIAVLNFEGTEAHVYPTVKSLSDRVQVVVSAHIWLDFMASHASKGAAIEYLRQHFNFSYQQSMCFGDYLNDMEMIAACYHSYAMDNAHPTVKQAARFQAPSNIDAGVIQVIERELLSH